MRWLGTAIGLMHAACSSSATTPDAIAIDAQTGGLIIELVAKGGVPQMPTPTVGIEFVKIHAAKIRIIGDSAPGDMRTTRTNEFFFWQDSKGSVPQLFRQAPPGVYSEVELALGGEDAVLVTGRAVRAGKLYPFEIRSQAEVPVNIAVNTELLARAFATSTIEVDVAAFIEDIDWDAVAVTPDERLFVGDGDPEMASVVANVTTAFKAAAN